MSARIPRTGVQNRLKNVRAAPALLRFASNHVPASADGLFFFPKNARAAPAVVPGDSKNAATGAAELLVDSNHVPAAAAEEFFVSKNSRAAPSLTFFVLFWTTFPPSREGFTPARTACSGPIGFGRSHFIAARASFASLRAPGCFVAALATFIRSARASSVRSRRSNAIPRL